jgi:cytochrome c oxidase assembly protein subunit 11
MKAMPAQRRPDQANRALLLRFALVTGIMFAFGYLLVPFYDRLCRATGLRDIDRADEVGNTQVDASRTVRLELDANVNSLPWRFQPETPIVNVHPGELMSLVFEVENTTDRPMTGQAVPSYGPPLAGEYFKKLECFCFRTQSFGPHEMRRMPVVFVVDPTLPRDVTTITLSYTFFEVEGNRTARAASPEAGLPTRSPA